MKLDNEIDTARSAFALRPNESLVYDGITKRIPMSQVTFNISMGYINADDFKILETVSAFGKVTSRQITQILNLNGTLDKDKKPFEQEYVAKRLKRLLNNGLITRSKFSSDEGESQMRVYSLDTNGKHVLKARNIKCYWQPTDNIAELYVVKQKLLANQILISYKEKVKAYNDFELYKYVVDKTTKQRVFFPLVMSLNNEEKKSTQTFVFEIVRRNENWDTQFVERMTAIKNFYKLFQANECGFAVLPQLIIVGEDNIHLKDIFSTMVVKDLFIEGMPALFSTDTNHLEEKLNKSLRMFQQDKPDEAYKLKIIDYKLLG